MITINCRPHPFSDLVYQAFADPGSTLTEILGPTVVPSLHVSVDGETITRDRWDDFIPPDGSEVVAVVVPEGVDTAAYIAGALAVSQAAAYAITAVVTVALSMGMSMALNALVAPQQPKGASGGISPSRFSLISGASNRFAKFEPLPRLYGTFRIFPPLAANYYSSTKSNNQYFNILLFISYGRLSIDGHIVGGPTDAVLDNTTALTTGTIRVGETNIGSYKRVEYQIGRYDQLNLFTRNVYEETLSVLMPDMTTGGGGWLIDGHSVTRTTQPNTLSFEIDIGFQALISVNAKGVSSGVSCEFQIDYRLVGATPWTTIKSSWIIGAATKQPLRRTYKSPNLPAAGQYEIRITRTRTAIDTRDTLYADATLTALRSIRADDATTLPWKLNKTCTMMALRIKATGQLNGMIDSINLLATSVLPAWNGTAWVDTTTANPAWAYADALRGAQLTTPIPDSMLDLPGLLSWANACATDGLTYNWYHQDKETLLDRIKAIATTGRASWGLVDRKFGVIRDTSASPVQLISPRNSSGLSCTRVFADIPQAIRVQYVDPVKWVQAERVVVDDGYAFDGKDAFGVATANPEATRIEELQTQGVTNSDQAWKEGRYFLAAMRLRPETWTVTMDAENLIATRGDTVKLAYDTLAVGLAYGRVKSLSGTPSTVVVDTICTMQVGKTYAIRVRQADNTQVLATVTTNPGDQTTLVLTSTLTGTAAGDLFVFGETALDSIDAKILSIDYGDDLSANIKLIPAAPGIYSAYTGTIPAYNPGITRPVELQRPAVPAILSAALRSDLGLRDADGAAVLGLAVTWTSQASGVPVGAYEIRWIDTTDIADPDNDLSEVVTRVSGDLTSYVVPNMPPNTPISVDVRAMSVWGRWGDWSTAVALAAVAPQAVSTPTTMAATSSINVLPDGTLSESIGVTWDAAKATQASFELSWQADNETTPHVVKLGQDATGYRIPDVAHGHVYALKLRAIGYVGMESAWATLNVTANATPAAPNAPTALAATSALNAINWTWTNSTSFDYDRIELWTATTNNRAVAALTASINGDHYSQPAAPGVYYAWVRAIGRSGLVSGWYPSGATSGIPGTADSASTNSLFWSQLAGNISETQLTTALGTRLNGIEQSAAAIYWLQHEIGNTAATTYDLQYQINSVVSVTSTKNTVFRQSTTPTAIAAGDIWIDTGNGNAIKVWTGATWTLSDNTAIAANTAAISTETAARTSADSAISGTVTSLTATVNTKATTFYQSTAPTATATGDLWVDTGNGNSIKRWSGSAWVAVDNTAIAAATANITTLQGAQATTESARAWSDYWTTSEVGLQTATVEVHTESINGLSAQWTAKIDVNGYVSGFGLASDTVNGTPVSTFMVRADRFAITNGTNTRNTIGAGNLTRSGTTATLNYTAHGLATGDWIELRGVTVQAGDATTTTPSGWNHLWQVTVVNANQVTFGVPNTLSTPAIGTMDWTKVYMPLTILTTTDGAGNPPGVYIDKARIKIADIDTLKIAGNSVVLPETVDLTGSGSINLTTAATYYSLGSISLGSVDQSTTRLVTFMAQFIGNNNTSTNAQINFYYKINAGAYVYLNVDKAQWPLAGSGAPHLDIISVPLFLTVPANTSQTVTFYAYIDTTLPFPNYPTIKPKLIQSITGKR